MIDNSPLAAGGPPGRHPARSSLAIVAVRLAHSAISVVFLSCLAYVYRAALARKRDGKLVLASGALALEGLIVVTNRGDCPLGVVHRRFGDEKTFFELFLPPRVARAAVPFLGATTLLGWLLVVVRPPRQRER